MTLCELNEDFIYIELEKRGMSREQIDHKIKILTELYKKIDKTKAFLSFVWDAYNYDELCVFVDGFITGRLIERAVWYNQSPILDLLGIFCGALNEEGQTQEGDNG